MTEKELKHRTRAFAPRVLKLIDTLPETRSGRVLAGQLGRSGTSVGANHRAACRSRSVAEMISKLSVEEEADEFAFWLELVAEHGLLAPAKLASLLRAAEKLTAIMVASRKTLRLRNQKSRIENRK